MTTNPYIHPVPVGATIPAGTKWATVMVIDRNYDFKQDACHPLRFTAEPIPAPRSAPPAEPGTILLDVTANGGSRTRNWERGYYCPEIDRQHPWLLCAEGDHQWYGTGDLVSWTVADVVPRTDPAPDPLDENDHRDRIDCQGDKLRRLNCGSWHYGNPDDGRHVDCATKTLKRWASQFGPIRFAYEV